LQLRWSDFRRDLPLTLALAFPGVAVAAAVVTFGMHAVVGWSWVGAGFFGILIAATDPVSVIAAFKEMKAEKRLSMVVETESLLNDGSAAVGFAVLLAVVGDGGVTPLGVAGALLWTVAGGVLVGAGVSGLMLIVGGRTDDHLVKITLTTITAYGSFLIAEHFHTSGVLASLTAGLLAGNTKGLCAFDDKGYSHVLSFWEYAAFLANSVVFILIGGHEAHQPLRLYAAAAGIAIVLVLLGRAVAVYPLCAVVRRMPFGVDLRYQHVLFWGGLRGALALALALALPATVPEQREIVVVCFAVVAFSIFVQGLTMPWLLRRFRLVKG
jgi:CPA1 family monovalent cation:H+ antiporter